jgi:hypothetical protein
VKDLGDESYSRYNEDKIRSPKHHPSLLFPDFLLDLIVSLGPFHVEVTSALTIF